MNRIAICAAVLGCTGMLSLGAVGQASCNMSGMGGQAGMGQDKTFVENAALGNYTEITFSNLALQKSTNPKVKAFAQKMITDHTQLQQEMQPVAQQMGVTPPTALDSQHQQLYDALNQLSGTQFDMQYMQDMDQDHHKTLDMFKQEESTTQNKQLKPLVKKGEKAVAQHTEMADKMVKSMGGTVSASGM